MGAGAMIEWLAMGGHGVYVWSAYGLSAAALLGMGVWPWLALRRAKRRVADALGPNEPSSDASDDMEPDPEPGGTA